MVLHPIESCPEATVAIIFFHWGQKKNERVKKKKIIYKPKSTRYLKNLKKTYIHVCQTYVQIEKKKYRK